MTTSPASTGAGAGKISVMTNFIATETFVGGGGSQVLMTIGGYSKLVEALVDAGGSIESERFRAGGHSWYIEYRHEIDVDDPSSDEDDEEDADDEGEEDADDEDEEDAEDWVAVFLCLDDAGGDDKVEAKDECYLLEHSGKRIHLTRDTNIFSSTSDRIDVMRLYDRPNLEDSFHVRCDVTVVDVTEVKPLHLHSDLVRILASKVGGDVTFVVAGELFTAHRCVLAARSEVFMDEFFYPEKENAAATGTCVRIDDMEPRVFKALLHFIYTDTLPKINKGDEVAMAIGLLVAADRYKMSRLGWICADILCVYVDARSAVATLELAKKHGYYMLEQACIKSLKDLLAKADH